jgi:8-oxo-dGTP diphosphatase
MLLVIRHARAGSRKEWNGPDIERPLSKKGRRQADGLVEILAPYPIEHLVSSPYVRCLQTVKPLAKARHLEIEPRRELAEGAAAEDPLALVRELSGTAAAVCTHGDIVALILFGLAEQDGLDLPEDPAYPKGSVWVLEEVDGKFKSAKYLPPPAE